jgi:DNA-binding response OmpR family regulator
MTLAGADRFDRRVRVLICESDPRIAVAIAHGLGEAGLKVVTMDGPIRRSADCSRNALQPAH